jgi:general secretion pathway protein G
MKRSFPLAKVSGGCRQFSAQVPSVHRVVATPYAGAAFTLLELLAVITIIGILAGLTLGTVGYVNTKGAESRARAEVAALCAAIDRYHVDFGTYPPGEPNLFKELTGQGQINTNTLYFEPSEASRRAELFVSPWGSPYKYNATNTNELRNVGFYDLWVEPPNAKDESEWIHN